MTASLVLTIIGRDRPGLVEAVSESLTAHEANWLESRMASLAGTFAGVVLAGVPDASVAALTATLQGLASEGIEVTVRRGDAEVEQGGSYPLHLELVGQDRPGIVRDISRVLAGLTISIDEFETEVSEASWSGEALFHATAELHVPRGVPVDTLRTTLEALANELMVDIDLQDLPA